MSSHRPPAMSASSLGMRLVNLDLAIGRRRERSLVRAQLRHPSPRREVRESSTARCRSVERSSTSSSVARSGSTTPDGPVPLADPDRRLGRVPVEGGLERADPEALGVLEAGLRGGHRLSRIAQGEDVREVDSSAQRDRWPALALRDVDPGLDDALAFEDAADLGEGGPLRDQRIRREVHEVLPLGAREHPVGDADRLERVAVEEVRAGELRAERDPGRAIRRDPRTRPQRAPGSQAPDRPGTPRAIARPRAAVAASGSRPVPGLALPSDRVAQEIVGPRVAAGGGCRLACPDEQVRLLARIGRHLQRLVEEGDRLLVRAERGRPFRRSPEGDPSLPADGVRLGARRGFLECGEIVGGQRADQLVLAERLEMACRGEMPVAAVALGQGRIRDLADERLDEAVLAALGRPLVDLLDEDLAPDETAQARLEIGRVGRGDGRQAGRA